MATGGGTILFCHWYHWGHSVFRADKQIKPYLGVLSSISPFIKPLGVTKYGYEIIVLQVETFFPALHLVGDPYACWAILETKNNRMIFSPTAASINLLMFGSEGCDYDPADISHPSKIKEQCFGLSSKRLNTWRFVPDNATVRGWSVRKYATFLTV